MWARRGGEWVHPSLPVFFVWNPDPYSMQVPGIDLNDVKRGSHPIGELFPRIGPA